MALDKTTLETAIETALNNQSDKEVDPAEARKQIAKDLASAFDVFVKSASINYVSGLSAPSGVVTGKFTGNLS